MSGLNLNLEVEEINGILAGLGELPAKQSYELINKIKGQATAQLQPQIVQAQEAGAIPEGQQLLTEA